jgi:putative hydrolase of the HAD superfamily
VTTPSALILDFGGVLTTSLTDVFTAFSLTEGLHPGALVETSTTNSEGAALWHALERGGIDQADFDARLGALLGIDPDRLLDRLAALLRRDERMLDALATVRANGVRTAVLSNSWGSGYLDPYAPWEFEKRSDVVVLSHEVHLRKPEPTIFEISVDRLGVPAPECVFVDDIAAYLASPAELGMTTIHHTDTTATVARLGALFGMPLPHELSGDHS